MQYETSEHSDIKVNYQSSESKQTMEHKPSCQQIKSPASPKISEILRSLDAFHRIHNSLSLFTAINQISPVNVLSFHLFNICVNIILPSSPWLAKLTLPFKFSNHTTYGITFSKCHMLVVRPIEEEEVPLLGPSHAH
jgi:hypothetical protein